MDNIPTDPDTKRKMNAGIDGVPTTTTGEYAYIPIEKRGIPNNAFIIMAATETV